MHISVAPELLYAGYSLAFPLIALMMLDVVHKRCRFELAANIICFCLLSSVLYWWFYLLGPRVYVFAYPILCVAGILPMIKLIAIKLNCLSADTVTFIRSSFWNFYMFLITPAEISPNPNGVNIPALTKRRLQNGLLNLLCLIIINNAVIFFHANQFPVLARGFVTAFQLVFCFSASADLSLWLMGMLTNNTIFFEDMFVEPYFVESPKDFWSHRWNLVAHKYICKLIYFPLKGTKYEHWSFAIIAMVIGIVHEIPMAFLPSAKFGYWTAIFCLHMAAVYAQKVFEKHFPNMKQDPAAKIVMRVGMLTLLAYTSDMSYKGFGMSVEQMASEVNSLILYPTQLLNVF